MHSGHDGVKKYCFVLQKGLFCFLKQNRVCHLHIPLVPRTYESDFQILLVKEIGVSSCYECLGFFILMKR